MPARRTRLAPSLAVVAVTALLAGCSGGDGASSAPSGGSGEDAKVSVVASTDVWGDIARTVGGDAVEVTSLVSGASQDPHSYEATPRDRLAVADAAVVVVNGGGYDDYVDRLVEASGTSAPVVDAVDAAGPAAEQGGEPNEHVWYDMATVAEVGDRIAAALGRADPAGASTFSDNADALRAQLDSVSASQAGVRRDAQGAGILVTEPVPLYMTAACGLADLTPDGLAAAVEEGADVPPATMADAEALLRDRRVAALVHNDQTTSAQTEALVKVAEEAGVPVVPVGETLPEGEDVVTWMRGNVEALRTAVVP